MAEMKTPILSTDSKQTFKPVKISNAEVKINKEHISQYQLLAESEEEFDPS